MKLEARCLFLFCETVSRVSAVGKKISAERRNQLQVKYSMRHAQKGNNPDLLSHSAMLRAKDRAEFLKVEGGKIEGLQNFDGFE